MTPTKVVNPQNLMATIQGTPVMQIANLDFVKEKYIYNYNACNKEKIGELMYHKNTVALMQQMASNAKLQSADPFSIYAVIVTAAANGYSLDPQDNEVYVICRDGKACLDRQAGAHVKKLQRTGQIRYADQAKLVYQGDIFEVEGGRVKRHVETFQSDTIIAGYVRMVTDSAGNDRYFIYRKSDWESWRKKSPNPKSQLRNGRNGEYTSESLWDGGIVGGTQPDPGFLRTKIIKHAASEKCWSSISVMPVETYAEIEIEDGDDLKQDYAAMQSTEYKEPQTKQQAASIEEINFTENTTIQPTVKVDMEDENF